MVSHGARAVVVTVFMDQLDSTIVNYGQRSTPPCSVHTPQDPIRSGPRRCRCVPSVVQQPEASHEVTLRSLSAGGGNDTGGIGWGSATAGLGVGGAGNGAIGVVLGCIIGRE